MRWAEKGLRIWALVALIVIICIAWRFYRREGFQIQPVDEAASKSKIASLQTQLESYRAQEKTLQPGAQLQGVKIQIDNITAQINAINTELTNMKINTSMADPATARALACSELADLRKHFLLKITEVRSKMSDLSGTQVLGVALKDENLRYQNRYASNCDNLVNSTQGTGLTDIQKAACISLASQDDPLYNNVLPAYDTTNTELYKEDLAIGDNVAVINDTMTLIQCDVSGIVYSADDDIGTINVEEIQAKLNELSPYYISSGTLDYVTKYLVGNGLLDTALYSSTQILREVNNTLTQAKVLSDKIFLG
jgi:hypothetical protein